MIYRFHVLALEILALHHQMTDKWHVLPIQQVVQHALLLQTAAVASKVFGLQFLYFRWLILQNCLDQTTGND